MNNCSSNYPNQAFCSCRQMNAKNKRKLNNNKKTRQNKGKKEKKVKI